MCGRFLRTTAVADIADAFFVEHHSIAIDPSFNISPSQRVVAVGQTTSGNFLFDPLWGFEASWKTSTLVINARIESVEHRVMFRDLLSTNRCAIPMSGYYEWVTDPETLVNLGAPSKKVPYCITASTPMVAAGLWIEDAGQSRVVMLTRDACDSVRFVHHRMPVLLSSDQCAEWLKCGSTPSLEKLAVGQYSDLEATRVGYAVNNSRNDSRELVMPFSGETQERLF